MVTTCAEAKITEVVASLLTKDPYVLTIAEDLLEAKQNPVVIDLVLRNLSLDDGQDRDPMHLCKKFDSIYSVVSRDPPTIPEHVTLHLIGGGSSSMLY